MKDIDKSKLKTSNFIVYSTNCDLTEVNPAIRHLEITTDNPQSQLDDKSQKSESSFHRHNPETLHKTRKQGGTVLCIIDNSAEVKTDSLRSVIREKSIELKDKGICLNAIVNQVCFGNYFSTVNQFVNFHIVILFHWISLASVSGKLNHNLIICFTLDISTYNSFKPMGFKLF